LYVPFGTDWVAMAVAFAPRSRVRSTVAETFFVSHPDVAFEAFAPPDEPLPALTRW